METAEKNMNLGGNIVLSGFSDLNGGDMVIIKKIVGNHVKRITEIAKKFEQIKINLKVIHETEKSKKFEFQVKLIAERNCNAELIERNLYVGIDKVLKKIIAELE